jgi:hypothetical protein
VPSRSVALDGARGCGGEVRRRFRSLALGDRVPRPRPDQSISPGHNGLSKLHGTFLKFRERASGRLETCQTHGAGRSDSRRSPVPAPGSCAGPLFSLNWSSLARQSRLEGAVKSSRQGIHTLAQTNLEVVNIAATWQRPNGFSKTIMIVMQEG